MYKWILHIFVLNNFCQREGCFHNIDKLLSAEKAFQLLQFIVIVLAFWSKISVVTPPIGGENWIVRKGETTKQYGFAQYYSTNNIQFFKCTLQQFTQSETYRSGSPCSLLIASRISCLHASPPRHSLFSPSTCSWHGPLSRRAPWTETVALSAGSTRLPGR